MNEGQPDPAIRFQRERVKMLMRALGLEKSLSLIWDEHHQRRGKPELTFHGFDRCFPTFPWTLKSQVWYSPPTSGATSITLKFWMKHIQHTRAWQTYRDDLDDHERRQRVPGNSTRFDAKPPRPLGLVFSFQSISGGLILHNAEPQATEPYFVFHQWHQDGTLRRYVIERYSAWLKAISKQGWTPKSKDTARPQVVVAAKKQHGGAGIHPWMVTLLGIGPDTLVLAWVVRVLYYRHTRAYAKRFRVLQEGQLCAHATQERIAKELGLSPRQVRTGLARLRQQKLIGSAGCYIWLRMDRLAAARKALKSCRKAS